MRCVFGEEEMDRKGHGEGDVKNVFFIGDIFKGCSFKE